MPHQRLRFATEQILKLAKLWPVVGVLGPRQVGKTTLLHRLLNIPNTSSLDDFESREEALRSPRTFLAKIKIPTVIDEVQKAPPLFDAIKLKVDQKRIPGSFFLTGSADFSAKIGIRESLTGRIGTLSLHPMTAAELHEKPFRKLKDLASPLTSEEDLSRFSIEQLMPNLIAGGMPVPAFLRDPEQRFAYWNSWVDATLNRDLPRFFKRSYDPDLAFSILNRIGSTLAEGELPTLRHFSQPASKLRTYLSAMKDVFLLRKISCHERAIGTDAWLPFDSGLAAFLMKGTQGEGASLSLARCFLWNEWLSQANYQGNRLECTYYKSAQGSCVDAVLGGVPFRLVPSTSAITRRQKWEERPLAGAMKKLGSKVGYLVAPLDSPAVLVKQGIGVLPWSAWS